MRSTREFVPAKRAFKSQSKTFGSHRHWNIPALQAPKFIRDSVHDIVRIDSEVELRVIDTIPVQRLKRIRQLGVAATVYPGADHSRFSHSIGCFHLANRMLNQLGERDESQRLVVKLAALLHDVGHGPFSHLFERVLKEADYQKSDVAHEKWTTRIVLEYQQLTALLNGIDSSLPRNVSDVISNQYEPKYLSAIVSSQFDVDRFDYMLRDSLMTGVHYGRFDLNWVIRNLSVAMVQELDEDHEPFDTQKIVIDARRGLSCLEDYLLGNWYLYRHVYYHHTIQSVEGMIIKLLLRAVHLIRDGNKTASNIEHPALRAVAKQKVIQLQDYLSLDDNTVLSWIEVWASRKRVDRILKDLAQGIRDRHLFKCFDVASLSKPGYHKALEEIKKLLKGKRLDPTYYLVELEPSRVAYKNFFFLREKQKLDQEIHYLDENGRPRPYSGIKEDDSRISRAILDTRFSGNFIAVPAIVKQEVKQIIEGYAR